jgi:hypothetical protein
MAMEKVNLADATIKINAKSNTAVKEEITCLVGELSFSKGERDFTETLCHSGATTGTGIKKYPEGEFSIIFDSSNTYGAQLMLQAALDHTGDFATDSTLQFEVEFNNSKGTNGAKMNVDMIIGSFTVNLTQDGDSQVVCKYKQLDAFTLTAAA